MKRDYKETQPSGAVMLLSFLLSRFNRSARFVWSPALDLKDHAIYSTLLPHTQY
jgi:hypothetical protein